MVKLTTPAACAAVPPAPADLKVKDAQDYILANGVKADTDALGDILTESAHIRKLTVEPVVGTIKVAVTAGREGQQGRGLHRQPEGSVVLQGRSGSRLRIQAAACR